MKKDLLKDKEFWIAFVYFCIGVTSIVLFSYNTSRWVRPEWFYSPERFNPYTTVNTVSKWAEFSYLTYISQLLFAIWGIVRFIAILFNIEKLKAFTNNSYVVLFICLNQLFVLIFYTLSQLLPGQNFGLYAKHAKAIKNLILNLTNHYFFTIAAIVYFFIHKHSTVQFKKSLLFLTYFIVYYTIVKLTGMYCYSFDWYPYPIFSTDSIWYNIFGSLKNYNATYALLMIMTILILILAVYLLLLYLAVTYINKKCNAVSNTNAVSNSVAISNTDVISNDTDTNNNNQSK